MNRAERGLLVTLGTVVFLGIGARRLFPRVIRELLRALPFLLGVGCLLSILVMLLELYG